MTKLKLAGIVALLACLFILPSARAGNFDYAGDQDSDADGMSDEFECLGKLDPDDPADGLFDTDRDGLLNVVEAGMNTDPSAPDTDRDGFGDENDQAPVSRAVLLLGHPVYTFGDFYVYFHPAWLSLVFKSGGE